jgi:ABC-2 type transport system ATP-binding protein
VITGAVSGVGSGDVPLTYSTLSAPNRGGYVLLDKSTGGFTYVPKADLVNSRGSEQFSVLVSQATPFDRALEKLPLLGALTPQLLTALHQAPVLGRVLTPVIGGSVVAPVIVDIAKVVPENAPVARTFTVTSFDGTAINVHFYPASGLTPGQHAPTVFNGPGIGFAGDPNPNSPWGDQFNLFSGNAPLRHAGYNVVTWDPRGEFGSGGELNLNSPAVEGRDLSAMIDAIAKQAEVELDGPRDPRMGMIGGSLGGGIQLIGAGTDHRIDAIVPAITWNSLSTSLYRSGDFKTGWAALLMFDELKIGAHVLPELYQGLLTGAVTGRLTQHQQDLLAARNPLVGSITTPTLLLQAAGDSLFGLGESAATAQTLAGNGVPVKMVWFCGGHGVCLAPGDAGAALVHADTLAWLARYVQGQQSVSTGTPFEWLDQNGHGFSSDVLPSDPKFAGSPISASGGQGLLPIIPILGGSGPQPRDVFPYSLTEASRAGVAVNLKVPGGSSTAQIVGAPQLSVTYSGLGTARFVYAQLVDNTTGLVVGDIVTPVPVTLDGKTHSITLPLEEIAYTLSSSDSLTVQLTGSATDYENLSAIGVLDVTSLSITLPTVGAGADVKPVVH